MYPLFVILGLLVSVDASVISTPVPVAPVYTATFVAPDPEVLQYRVGVIHRRWRCDYPLTTMIHGRDTLCYRATNSEKAWTINQTDLPDTAEVIVVQHVLRFEQDRYGRVLSGPKLITRCNVDLLYALDVREKHHAPNPATFPRRTPAPPIANLPRSAGRPTSADLQVVEEANGDVYVEWPRYTAVLYGDTLTRGLLGSEQYEAMKQLGYSETDTYDLFVTIERYLVQPETGVARSGPTFLGPMTKDRFDQRRVIFTRLPERAPQPELIFNPRPTPK